MTSQPPFALFVLDEKIDIEVSAIPGHPQHKRLMASSTSTEASKSPTTGTRMQHGTCGLRPTRMKTCRKRQAKDSLHQKPRSHQLKARSSRLGSGRRLRTVRNGCKICQTTALYKGNILPRWISSRRRTIQCLHVEFGMTMARQRSTTTHYQPQKCPCT
jgi:hypothetical protein